MEVLIFSQQNDITGYSPYGARAREEYDRYQGFFAQNGLGVAVYIFALAKDGGSMIRDRHLKEVVRVSVCELTPAKKLSWATLNLLKKQLGPYTNDKA